MDHRVCADRSYPLDFIGIGREEIHQMEGGAFEVQVRSA
jgi:hypothetical protein